MSKKSSGLSGAFTIIIAIFLVFRIGMIMSRNSSNSTHANWNSSYLMWSVFVLVAVVGSYFWNQSKKGEEEE